MNEKKVPELRFKGFFDEWEQRKLSEGTSKIGDGLHGTPKYTYNGDVFFINGNNLVNGKIKITEETKLVTEFDQSKDDKALNTDTILMSINGTIGNLAWYNNEKVMLGKSTAYLIVSEFDKSFIYSYLQNSTVKNYFLNNLTGTTIKNLGLKTIRNTKLFLPIWEEQKKIGSFFKQLDNTIALHQRKLELLKQLKQAYLQQMFPKKDEKFPELRFAGFEDNWGQRKLLDLSADTYGGGTPKTKNSEYWQGEIPWIQSSDLSMDLLFNIKPRKYITENAVKNSATKIVPANSIAIVTRVGVGKLAYISYEFTTSQDFLSLANLKIDPFFGVYSFYQMLQNELNKTQGTSIKGITKSELLDKRVEIPIDFNEQQKIGTFFKQLDNTIALHQNKIEQLNSLKLALLKKMFI